MNTPQFEFDHEKLVAYQRSIQFVAWVDRMLEQVSSKLAVHDQFDRVSTSVPLNIAEGNTKYTGWPTCIETGWCIGMSKPRTSSSSGARRSWRTLVW